MGKRGPAPEPSILKYIRGNPSKETLNAAEPTPDLVSADVPPPDTLGQREAEVWRDVAAKLVAMRVLTEADLPLLERYCIERVLYFACYEKVKALGEQYIHMEPDPNDPSKMRIKYTQVAPWATQMHRHHAAMLRIEQEFGMTPSSRSQVTVTHGSSESSPIAAFIAKRGDRTGA